MDVDALLSVAKYGGIVLGAISGVFAALTKTHDKNRKLTRWGRISVGLTLACFLAAAVAQYTEGVRKKRDEAKSREDARALRDENAKILGELQVQKDTNARSEREFREKFQQVLIQLNAAKQEDSKRITEEKIHVIQKDFSDWATNFVNNLPRIKSEFDKTKQDFEQGKLQAQIDEVKKEIQLSQQSYAVLSFAIRYTQETIRAYAKQRGKEIKIDSINLPENFYEKETAYEIRLTEKAIWKFAVAARRPAGENAFAAPNLTITFTDSEGKESGKLRLLLILGTKTFSMRYQAAVPSPDPNTIAGNRDLTDYETPIREVFQRVIEAQLVQAGELPAQRQ